LPALHDSAKSLGQGFEKGLRMASHETEYSTADGNDYAEHERTYELFLTMTKWGVISIVILLAGMAYFLT